MEVLPTLWAMAAGACLVLAVPTLAVWATRRESTSSLLFGLTALAASAVALSELAMMRAPSGAEFLRAMRLGLPPIAVLVVSLSWFVAVHLGTSRRGLAWLLTSGWTLVVVLNFVLPHGIVFSELPTVSPLQLSWG